MDRKYWVVGGEYEDCGFGGIRRGSQVVMGPFADELRARTEWQRLTFRDNCPALARYHIAVEEQRV